MDTGGRGHFDSQNRLYYRRADCCLLIYDITNKESFNDIKNFYIKEIKDNCIKDIIVILLGNKSDLKNERKISTKEGTKLLNKYKFSYFMETSCEENFNIVDAFETIIITTNNEMIKSGRLNYEPKIDIENLGKENIEMKKKRKKRKKIYILEKYINF